jgi:hypothetical protein
MHARSTFLAISSVRSARNGYAEAIDRFFSDVSTRSNGTTFARRASTKLQ